MREQRVRVQIAASELAGFVRDVEEFAKKALVIAAESVKHQVMDFVPRWKGGLVRAVKRRAEDGGRRQLIYGEGLVFCVHEHNAVWSKLPPHAAILEWVVGKLHKSGEDAESVAWAVRRKIKARGLTLPNREKRGKMIQRTRDLMRRTGFHFQAFGSAMKQLLRRA